MTRTSRSLAAVLVFSTSGLAADWPQWRGPARNAVLAASVLGKILPEPKVLWRIEAGEGQSSPVFAGERLVYLEARDGQETACCAQRSTGEILWRVAIAPVVKFQNDFGDGPRCTPLIDEDRVYVQSCGGEFRCLDLAAGKTIWKVNFGTAYGATFLGNASDDPEAKETASRRHGNNGCAVVDGQQVLVPVGGARQGATLVAFDKTTGRENWRVGQDNTAYSSVMLAQIEGTRQAIHFTADALMGVDAATGQLLWRVPLKTGAKRHICTPVIVGNTITVASSGIGTIRFRIQRSGAEWKADQVWTNSALKTNMATPIVVGGHLYTLSAGSRTDLVCVDFDSGKVLWSQAGFGDYASLLAVGEQILALNSTGELFVLKADPSHYELIARVQVCGKTWASPAYDNQTIYVKDATHLSALLLAQ